MTKYEFVKRFLPEAEAAEKRFHLNPVVMLAQAGMKVTWRNYIVTCLVLPDMARPTSSGTVAGWNWSRADCLSASIPIRRVAFWIMPG